MPVFDQQPSRGSGDNGYTRKKCQPIKAFAQFHSYLAKPTASKRTNAKY